MALHSGGLALPHRAATVKKAADQLTANYSGQAAIAWDTVVIRDIAVMHDSGANTLLTVPPGYTRARFDIWVVTGAVTVGAVMSLNLFKNGALFSASPSVDIVAENATPTLSLTTPWLPVAEGDDFAAMLYSDDNAISVIAARSSFGMEVAP